MKNFAIILFVIFIYPSLYAQNWESKLPDGKTPSELTLNDYKTAFDTYWAPFDVKNGYYIENGVKQKAYGWKQFQRWYWEMKPQVDHETSAFPKQTAQQVYDDYIKANPSQKQSKSANWSSLGTSSSNGGYAGVGRLNCIAFHPTDNNTYWVGAPAGGLWKTTNNGASWTCLTDDNDVLGISDIAIPSDYATSQTIYIATGDKDGWDNRSIGVLKSTNAGTTWNTTGLQYVLSDGQMVNRLLIDPNNNQTLIASTSSGVYKTTNGGTSWSTQLTNTDFIDMEFKPSNFNVLYGSTKWGEIYLSTDGGSSWSLVFDSGNRIELAVSDANSNYVYAVVVNDNNGLLGIYKSTNSGTSYSQVFNGNTKGLLNWSTDGGGTNEGQGRYDLSLAVAPGDANTILVGGINTWKSTNGGSSWTLINHWYGGGGAQAVHADKHQLKFRSNGDLFECNDGGVYFSSNDGAVGSWVDKTNGIVISQMYKLGVSQSVSDETITGLQDNGTKLRSGGVWADVKGGDGMDCLIDYTDVNIQYGSYVRGQISRTTNHWASNVDIEPSAAGVGAWVTPYIIDPVDHNTLYAGYADVWKTINKGNSWVKISTMNTSNKIRSMAIAPSNTSVLYVADLYHLWKTTSGGSAWVDVTGPLTNNSSITNIAIKDNDPNTVWVTLSGYNSYNIYQTVDGGSNWTNISTGLPELPTYSVVQNTQITNEVHLYLATELGVYFKKGNDNWIEYNVGLPNVSTRELEIYYDANPADSKLRLASWGRGLWESGLEAQNGNSSPIVINPISDVDLDDGFGTHTINISNVFEDSDGDALSYSVSNSNTSVVGVSLSGTTLTISENALGSCTVTVTANDGNGGSVNDMFSVHVGVASCAPPSNLTAQDLLGDGYTATLNWDAVTAFDEFRYDDGTATGQLGFQTGTSNSVLGSVHTVGADLNEMSWYLTDESGPHDLITLYVMGLDGNGLPDENNVLFTTDVSSTDEVWNTYTFASTITADEGFFIGIAYEGFVALGTDDGIGSPYEYVPNTHFYSSDYPAGEWTAWEDSEFEINGMIRAMGVEGAVNSYNYSMSIVKGSHELEYMAIDKPVNTEAKGGKELSGYNVYRDGAQINGSLVAGTTYEDANATGYHCFKVTAVYSDCGESGFSNEACVTVENNSSPVVINPIADIILDEGFGTHSIDISNVFNDPDGDDLTYSISGNNTTVVSSNLSGNTLQFTEVGIGVVIFTLTADDGNGGTVADEFSFSVNAAANNPPIVINPIADIVLDEGFGTHNIDISDVFEDADGDDLSYSVSASNTTVVSSNLSGNTLELIEIGNGVVTITLTANDGNGGTVADEFLLTVNAAANNPPIVVNPIADIVLDEGFGTYDIDISDVFEDADGDDLSYSVSGSNTTVVSLNLSGNTLELTEVGNGAVTITLTANDGNGGTVADEFLLTVNAAVNNPPIVVNPIDDIVLDEEFGTYVIDISDVFEDPDGDDLSYTVTNGNSAVIIATISTTSLFLIETGIGTTTITLTANDGNGGTVDDEFLVTVNAVNHPPIIVNPIADIVLDEGFGTYNIDISNVFDDPDGDNLSYEVSSSNTSIIVTSVSGNSLLLTEIGLGSVTIILTANDGNGETVSDIFTVTVIHVNSPPIVINPITDLNFDEGFGTYNIDISNVFEDADDDVLTYSVLSSNTSVIIASVSANTLLITEVGIGVSNITLTADDGNGGSGSDVFVVNVNAAGNNPPTVVNPISDVELDEGFNNYDISIGNVFNDPDGDVLTYLVSSSDASIVIASVSGNTLAIGEVGTGVATITLTADDGNGGAISDVFTVTVIPAPNNSPIVVNPISDVELDDGFDTYDIDISNVFEDPDSDILTYVVSGSNNSVVIPTMSGNSIVIVEVAEGAATITLTADDGNGGTVSDEFVVTVNPPVNNPPVVVNPIPDIDLMELFETYSIDISNVFNDADSDDLTYTVVAETEAFFIPTISGDFLILSEAGMYMGGADVTLTADDGNGGVAEDVFYVYVDMLWSVKELNAASVSIYPNPTSGKIHISIENYNRNIDIAVYSALGKLVIEKTDVDSEGLSLDLSDYERGVYFIKVTTDSNSIVKRVVIE